MRNSIKTYVEAKTMKVFFAITFKEQRFYVYTGMASSEKFTGLAFPCSTPNYLDKTKKLIGQYSDVENIIISYPDISFSDLKKKVKSLLCSNEKQEKKEREKGLLHYIDEYTKTKVKQGTIGIFLRTKRRIEDYDSNCTFETIDRNWLERFQAHELLKGRKMNGIAIDLRNIRTVFNWAIDNELTAKYPFRKFQIKNERQQYLYLNAEEMKEFRDTPVEPFMEKYRDIFMLGFYLIGINISDLLELPANSIRKGRLQYRRNKTSRLYDIKVEPEALAIIHKYKGTDHLLSILDEGTKEASFRRSLNDYIKRIGPVTMTKNKRGALIKKEITPLHPDIVWYTARRSWATIAAELDIPKETIGKALGHSEWDNTTTDLYISFDYKKVDEANRKVLDYLNNV